MSELEIKKITKKYFIRAIFMLLAYLLTMIIGEFVLEIYYGDPDVKSEFSWGTTSLPFVLLILSFYCIEKVIIDIHKKPE